MLRGASYLLRGLRLLCSERGLLLYGLPPLLLTGLALAAGLYAAVTLHDDLLALLWSAPSPGDGTFGVVMRGLFGLARALAFVLTASVALIASYLLSSVLAAPFNDLLSEAVERRVLGAPTPPFSWRALLQGTAQAVGLEALKLAAYLAIMVPTWLLSLLLPGPGGALHTLFAVLFTTAYLALDYVDWPASRRGLGVRARLRLLSAHKGPMLGFGVGVWVLLWVPFLNLLLMPIAVAGGTLLFLDLQGEAPNR